MTLPGIGSYTAALWPLLVFPFRFQRWTATCFGSVPAFPGSRLNIDLPGTKTLLEKSLLPLIPKERPGDLNQALMELGATVCLPNGQPQCLLCPLKDLCTARKEGTICQIPVRKEKKPRRMERKTVLILQWENKIALQKRPEQGLLAGLWEFPWLEGTYTEKRLREALEAVDVVRVSRLPQAKHIFTHIEWQMTGYWLEVAKPIEPFLWVEAEQLKKEYAVPSAYGSFLEEIWKRQRRLENMEEK